MTGFLVLGMRVYSFDVFGDADQTSITA